MTKAIHLDNWAVVSRTASPYYPPESGLQCLNGNATGHPKHPNEVWVGMSTSPIIGRCGDFVLTQSGNLYSLGTVAADYEKVYSDAKKRLMESLPEMPEPVDPEPFLETHYVVGFMFSMDNTKVALIRKKRPAWQAGLLNGIGGHVEASESYAHAMVREFKEETGGDSTVGGWERYAQLTGHSRGGRFGSGESRFHIDVLCSQGDLSGLKSKTDEEIVIVDVAVIHPLRRDMVDNTPWLVGLAIDCLEDGRPDLTVATYKRAS